MNDVEFLNYVDYYSKKRCFKGVLFAKVKGKYLIGPKVDENFNWKDFFKRINSSVIYNLKDYKKVTAKKMEKLYHNYGEYLVDSVVLEVRRKELIEHTFCEIG